MCINKIEKLFSEEINQYIKTPSNIAIALSGGADSMCLLLLTKLWNQNHQHKIHAIIVDHQLRLESTDEANLTLDYCNKIGIPATILKCIWDTKPTSNIQEQAREARYNLITQWCQNNSYPLVLFAHHKDDQAENVMIRILRGSGVDGLSSMAALSYYNNIKIIRPLLNITKNDIYLFLKRFNQDFIKDPSNDNLYFLRTQVRQFIANNNFDISPSLLSNRLASLATNMQRVKKFLNYETDEFIKNHVIFNELGFFIIKIKDINKLHEEIWLRVISKILSITSHSTSPIRFSKLIRLYKLGLNNIQKSYTINNCLLFKYKEEIFFLKETLPKETTKKIMPQEELIWDKRFLCKYLNGTEALYINKIDTKLVNKIIKGSFLNNLPSIRNSKMIAKQLLLTLPVFSINNKNSIPLINYYENTEEKYTIVIEFIK